MDSAERKKREAEKRARILRNQEGRINRIISDAPLVEKTEDEVPNTQQPLANTTPTPTPPPFTDQFPDPFSQFAQQFNSQFNNGQFNPLNTPFSSPFFNTTTTNIPPPPQPVPFKLVSKVLIFLLSLIISLINYPTITDIPPSIKEYIILLPITLALILAVVEYNTFSKHKLTVIKRDLFWVFLGSVIFTEALEDFYFPYPYQDSYLNLIVHSQVWLSLLTSLVVELALNFSLSSITSHIKTKLPLVSLLPESLVKGILRNLSKVVISIFLVSVLPSVFGLELECPVVFSKLLPNLLCGRFGTFMWVNFSLQAIRAWLEPSVPSNLTENKKRQ
eukprot:TRINITY_DN2910_c0_g1_i2.p1 TRINITY_DN2910_c0_g1~~TRINITY_DN2910_c0_g1_i2.p1  ORF type:complete len:333 (-),score=68.80 TRINITY_DN2910_c0_g1_i2:68-1066(-)